MLSVSEAMQDCLSVFSELLLSKEREVTVSKSFEAVGFTEVSFALSIFTLRTALAFSLFKVSS